MSELEKLKQEYDEKVAELQKSCSHTKKSPWTAETYRSSLVIYCTKTCMRCGKQVDRSLVADVPLPSRPFMGLPYEVRSKIYFLVDTGGIGLEEARKKYFDDTKKK